VAGALYGRSQLAVACETVDLAAAVQRVLGHRQRRIVAFVEMPFTDGEVQMLPVQQQRATVMKTICRAWQCFEQDLDVAQAVAVEPGGHQRRGRASGARRRVAEVQPP
jgi:hypothetical protein